MAKRTVSGVGPSPEQKQAFGKRIFALRARQPRSLIVQALAERGFKYSGQALANWENGEDAPPGPVVAALEECYELPRGELAMLLGYSTEGSVIERIEDRIGELQTDMRRVAEAMEALAQALVEGRRRR